jgi:hypothetical protein
MPPLRPAWVSLSTVIALLVVITLVAPLRALAAEPSVGVVTKVQNDAEIASVGGAVRASVGSVVRMRDEQDLHRLRRDGTISPNVLERSGGGRGPQSDVVWHRPAATEE